MKSRSQDLNAGRFLPRAQPQDIIEGELVQVESTNLAADISATVAYPAYATLLTGTITTTEASSFLNILFYCSLDFILAGPVVDRPVGFRLRLDGVLVPPSRSAIDNAPTSVCQSVAINRRVSVVAGPHTVLVEWTVFGTGTLRCFPATSPDEQGAHLILEEQRT